MAWRRAQGDSFVSLYGDVEARFWSKVDRGTPAECWPWQGTMEHTGYGQFFANGPKRLVKAHRYAYELLVGPIPSGMDLDHTCHDYRTCSLRDECPHRRCVNPAHLEPVVRRANVERSGSQVGENIRKTHCVNGHLLEGANLVIRSDGARRCRTCKNKSGRRSYWEKQK